jgi:Domain of unknown function (DUF4381)
LAEAQAPPADPVAGLIDIPLPPETSLWPQTWTARIIIAVVLIALVSAAFWFARQWWLNRYRREALAELERIEVALETGTKTQGLVDRLALLVRRAALAAFPREDVVALTGPAWLTFLDRTYRGEEFSQGSGRVLGTAPYQPRSAQGTADLHALIGLVRRWIKVHHA